MTYPQRKKLVLVGDGKTAEIVFQYFTYDSPWQVAAFATEQHSRQRDELLGLPVVDLEQITVAYPPDEFAAFAAVSSTHLNRLRKRLYLKLKALGYDLPSYVSSRSSVWRNVEIGENCLIPENTVLQSYSVVGNNVVMVGTGSIVSHHAVISDHVYFGVNCVVSGLCSIGEGSFLGSNCTLCDEVTIPPDTVIGAGAVVPRTITESGLVWVGNPARPTQRTAYETFGVPEREAPECDPR